MRAADIIIKKRGNPTPQPLIKEEIQFMVDGYVAKTIPDYQMSAFLMAIYFNGMSFEETAALTDCMLHSGEIINLHGKESLGLKGPFVDKHSTGGVGDKISIPLAPIAACLGVQIPMMSGRGLGHTGGTLDKLESITGYKVALSPQEFEQLIAQNGYAMTGQTQKIVPADRLMYALRDVTGTVESIPLITASILSKKVAEGSDALVFDVKYGSGAFMKTPAAAENLATSLVKTAQAMGKKAVALLTDMETPLGLKTGNYLEIEESLECLQGNGPKDVMELTYALASHMSLLAGKVSSIEEGLELCKQAVDSGRALEKFLKNVDDQGGDSKKLLEQQGKRRSPFHAQLNAESDGYLKIDAYKTGIACINLGVGRNKTSDKVDADSGIILSKVQGEAVKAGQKIMDVYAKDEKSLEEGVAALKKAVSYSKTTITQNKLILKEIK
ncbi:thymidine phosphorylase [uncultured Treponema sp.]|uniref:thymidine phosphorylase n=1 Tax=uncultured Treponema sp. TaxID=162155 RepID=UPI0027D9CB57|nr:thymidine phosphorylase [uncultured Treponema sp.]